MRNAIVLFLLVLPTTSMFSATVLAAEKPNVLMIAIDDLNDWVGCLGHQQAKTPNIDALANRGVLFTNAHCQAPICNPSRTSVMLGMRPSSTGIYVNSPWFRNTQPNKDRVTLSQYFSQNGYRTLTAGKIYHGSRQDRASFQTTGVVPGQRLKIDKQIQQLPSKSRLWDFGVQDYPEKDFGDARVASWAVGELAEKQDKPFFMAVGFYRPHVPFYAPQKMMDKFPLDEVKVPLTSEGDRDDLPEAATRLTLNPLPPTQKWFVESGKWREAVQAYYAAVAFTDAQVGRVLKALDESPHHDNTIVVLWSDHGFHLGEKERWAKQSLWERSTRVPLIISTPKGTSDRKCSRSVELLSLYPTLVELCGLPPRKELEGRSITALLDDPKAEWNYPALTTYQQNNHAVRTEQYRYIRYADGSEELYDHHQDPNEWKNLANQKSLDTVKEELAKWLPKVNRNDLLRRGKNKAN